MRSMFSHLPSAGEGGRGGQARKTDLGIGGCATGEESMGRVSLPSGQVWLSLASCGPSQLGDMQGVAGGRVGGGALGLEPLDVAAVAEQVASQGVTAVALLIIQLQAAVLTRHIHRSNV